jgi:D-alanyl-D-alanine dipeptidase
MKLVIINSALLFYITFALIPLTFIASNPNDLVDVRSINPTICIELRYATDNNFTGKTVYDCPPDKCFVLKCVAEKLDLIQKELEKLGLGLKIWDGLRTFEAQKRFWKICPDERYVSNPKKGGRHTRGTTVDVTLVHLSDGSELAMPTEFDNFTQKARSDYMDLPEEVIKNRMLLQNVMTKHGFSMITAEWWHFDLSNWRDFSPLKEVDFSDLIASNA